MSTHPTVMPDAPSAAQPPAELIPEDMLHSIAQQLAGRFAGESG